MQYLYHFLFILFCFTVSLNAQKYKGKLEGEHTSGKAEYEYYKKNYEKIWDGDFYYNSNDKFIINGHYSDNLKNGDWSVKLTNYHYDGYTGDFWITSNVKAQYNKGNKVGKWNVSHKVRKEYGTLFKGIINELANLFGEDEKIPDEIKLKEETTAFFENNHFSRNFNYNQYAVGSSNKQVTITGQFDKNGKIIGEWEYKSPETYELVKYKKGVLYFNIKRDEASGKVTKRIDRESFVERFFQNYDKSVNISIFNNEVYSLKKKTEYENEIHTGLKFWERETYNQIGGIVDGIAIYEIPKGSNRDRLWREYKIVKCYEEYDDCDKRKNKLKYEHLINKGDFYFNKNKYEKALDYYNKAISLNTDDSYAHDKKKKIKLLQFLETRRKKTFSYRKMNKHNYESTYTEIKNRIKEVLKESDNTGKLKLNLSYKIDTNGNTTFSKKVKNSTSKIMKNEIINSVKNIGLEPIYKHDYTINARADYDLEINHKKGQLSVKKTKTKTKIKRGNKKFYHKIKDNLSLKPMGKYKIKYSQININDDKTFNKEIFDYKTIGGPSNAFLSLLMPGLGTRYVSGGKKSGIGRTITVYGLIGTGAWLKYRSNQQYEKYHDATDQEAMDTYYEKANSNNKAAIVFASVGVLYWVYDVIWVTNKGFENLKNTKHLRNKFSINYIPENNGVAVSYKIKF